MFTLTWADESGTREEHDMSRLKELLARPDAFVWLDLQAPSPEERRVLSDAFGFHQLAIDDAFHPVQRPKLEEYEDWFFLVTYEVEYHPETESDDSLKTNQIAMFVRADAVVTVHGEPSEAIKAMHARCNNHGVIFRKGPDYLVYNLLDVIVDRYFPTLDTLDDQIDALEDRIVKEPRKEILDDIFTLKRTLIRLRKIAGPTREMLTMLTTRGFPVIRDEMMPYFRDVSDHLIRIYEILDSYRDLMSGALDAYLSNVSNQLNLTMQRLTIITVIFLPLTFITGIFGMNFRVQPWMPEWDRGQMFWAVMLGMGLLGAWLAWWFHRKRLL